MLRICFISSYDLEQGGKLRFFRSKQRSKLSTLGFTRFLVPLSTWSIIECFADGELARGQEILLAVAAPDSHSLSEQEAEAGVVGCS